MQRVEQKQAERITFDGIPGTPVFGYGWPPPGGTDNNRFNDSVQSAIRAVAKLDEAYAVARRDVRLSSAGQAERVQPLRAAAEATVRERRERLAAEAASAETARSALLAVPGLQPEDAAGALYDREIRERFGQLPERQREVTFAAMRRGDQERVLLALARDPFPTPHSQFARGMWEERVQEKHAKDFATLDERVESLAWADSALGALQGVLAKVR